MPQKEVSWIGTLIVSLELLCFPSSVLHYIPPNLLATVYMNIDKTFTGGNHFSLADISEMWLSEKTVGTGGELLSSPSSQARSVHFVFSLNHFKPSIIFLMPMLSLPVVLPFQLLNQMSDFLEIRFEYYAIRGHTIVPFKFSRLVVMKLWIHELVRWKFHQQHLIQEIHMMY